MSEERTVSSKQAKNYFSFRKDNRWYLPTLFPVYTAPKNSYENYINFVSCYLWSSYTKSNGKPKHKRVERLDKKIQDLGAKVLGKKISSMKRSISSCVDFSRKSHNMVYRSMTDSAEVYINSRSLKGGKKKKKKAPSDTSVDLLGNKRSERLKSLIVELEAKAENIKKKFQIMVDLQSVYDETSNIAVDLSGVDSYLKQMVEDQKRLSSKNLAEIQKIQEEARVVTAKIKWAKNHIAKNEVNRENVRKSRERNKGKEKRESRGRPRKYDYEEIYGAAEECLNDRNVDVPAHDRRRRGTSNISIPVPPPVLLEEVRAKLGEDNKQISKNQLDRILMWKPSISQKGRNPEAPVHVTIASKEETGRKPGWKYCRDVIKAIIHFASLHPDFVLILSNDEKAKLFFLGAMLAYTSENVAVKKGKKVAIDDHFWAKRGAGSLVINGVLKCIANSNGTVKHDQLYYFGHGCQPEWKPKVELAEKNRDINEVIRLENSKRSQDKQIKFVIFLSDNGSEESHKFYRQRNTLMFNVKKNNLYGAGWGANESEESKWNPVERAFSRCNRFFAGQKDVGNHLFFDPAKEGSLLPPHELELIKVPEEEDVEKLEGLKKARECNIAIMNVRYLLRTMKWAGKSVLYIPRFVSADENGAFKKEDELKMNLEMKELEMSTLGDMKKYMKAIKDADDKDRVEKDLLRIIENSVAGNNFFMCLNDAKKGTYGNLDFLKTFEKTNYFMPPLSTLDTVDVRDRKEFCKKYENGWIVFKSPTELLVHEEEELYFDKYNPRIGFKKTKKNGIVGEINTYQICPTCKMRVFSGEDLKLHTRLHKIQKGRLGRRTGKKRKDENNQGKNKDQRRTLDDILKKKFPYLAFRGDGLLVRLLVQNLSLVVKNDLVLCVFCLNTFESLKGICGCLCGFLAHLDCCEMTRGRFRCKNCLKN